MQIKKAQIRQFLRIYGISSWISLAALFITWLLSYIIDTTPLFPLLLLAVTISTWYIGLRGGAIATLITTLGTILLQPSAYTLIQSNNDTLVRLFIFVFSSVTTIFVVLKSKEHKKTRALEQKEKDYIAQIEKLQKENIHFQKEIKARDEFLSIASHELKTPLTSMLLQMQTAIHNIKNVSLANFSVASLMKMLESTEQQSARLSRMINDLLNVSLITTGRLELEKENVDLGQLVQDVSERFVEKATKEGGQIIVSTKENILGRWDKLRIEQVVTNLITNGIKYGNGKPIEIIVSHNDSFAQIKVTDHGIGIPREQQEKIFEKFERAVPNNHYKGLGVGLYITYQIVKAHKGKMKLASKLNSGSTFTVELPLEKDA
jgi:signal transduction histidine kinase